MFSTVLIANRGEIACRVIRTCEALGIRSVAVYSDADRDARHVQEATTAVRIGPEDARQSYLNIGAILDAARKTGTEAIHPGYGFLAENAEFARACADAGIVFIGPPVAAIETMGDKIRARHAVERRGVATVPGIAEPGLSDAELIEASESIGFPILIKPSAGGGGKGMHRVDDPADLPELLARARREAGNAFGDDTLFLERFVTNPRHIEVQVLADTHGHTVHLGERECSLQRRHQKVIEEAPSPLLDDAQRAAIGQAAVETAKSVGYVGAGTVEFIVSGDRPDEPFFMEMNTRLQVEHPVTELTTGVDLVEQQLRIAAGEALSLVQDEIRHEGHAVEARVYAEDPAAGFLPTGGEVLALHEPTGDGVRVDSSLLQGVHTSTRYDPMLAKVIAWAPTRGAALAKLDQALGHTSVLGVVTNIPFLRALLTDASVVEGNLDTGLIDREAERLATLDVPKDAYVLAALIAWAERWRAAADEDSRWARPDGWRVGGQRAARFRFDAAGDRVVTVEVSGAPDRAQVRSDGGEPRNAFVQLEPAGARVGLDGLEFTVGYVVEGDAPRTIWLAHDGDWQVREHRTQHGLGAGDGTPTLEAPMPGVVVSVVVESGATVEVGDPVVSVEAMKMEHVVKAKVGGVVEVSASVGQQVTRGQVLATITPQEHASEAGKEN